MAWQELDDRGEGRIAVARRGSPEVRYVEGTGLPETGETVELLTHYSSAVTTLAGSLLVRGGTLDRDEGLYLVSLDGNGKPVAELVASTGQTTAVKYLGTSVPGTITFDRIGQGVDLGWDFSRVDTDVWLTLVHERTGERSRRKIWSTDPAAPGGRATGTDSASAGVGTARISSTHCRPRTTVPTPGRSLRARTTASGRR
ncbi:hypothetical protein [Streptomyces sp. NPDC026092]|uniref:hypothetical protein n=1 Tax=Streptomyces sp. NPDC026092 TaxID=3154797 RepID=UPI0033F6B600